jgi:hypothetical protein
MTHTAMMLRWMRALHHWWLRLRLRSIKAQRNFVCRLATGHSYDALHGSGGDGNPSPQARRHAREDGR